MTAVPVRPATPAGVTSGLGRYAGIVLLAVALLGAILAAPFHGPGDIAALLTSGLVALVVQPAVVLLCRRLVPGNLTAKMGLGMIIRFLTLVLYAVIVVSATRLPATAALVSLASFYLLSSLIEPLVLES